nr:GNAT family N-acetyltransferase [Brucella intermedia]
MFIRAALPHDFKAILAIDTTGPSDERRADKIKDWINGNACYLVEHDGGVVAYGVLTYHFFDCGFIEMLMVSEEFRRKRLGLKLVNYFKTICIRPKLFTSTNQSNVAMQSLLAEADFKRSGYIDNLDENDPELIFFWKTNQSSSSEANRGDFNAQNLKPAPSAPSVKSRA